jgi:hypothetical protein
VIGVARRLHPGLDEWDFAEAARRLDQMPDEAFAPLWRRPERRRCPAGTVRRLPPDLTPAAEALGLPAAKGMRQAITASPAAEWNGRAMRRVWQWWRVRRSRIWADPITTPGCAYRATAGAG